jgi:hypothetical protein
VGTRPPGAKGAGVCEAWRRARASVMGASDRGSAWRFSGRMGALATFPEQNPWTFEQVMDEDRWQWEGGAASVGGLPMATLQEQQLAKDIVVAWLNISASSNSVISDTIRNPTTAGNLIAEVYKTIVQAISETSTPAVGTDATG